MGSLRAHANVSGRAAGLLQHPAETPRNPEQASRGRWRARGWYLQITAGTPCNPEQVRSMRGAVVVGSLRAQLQSLAGARLATPALHFNADGAVDGTRAVAAQWVPSMAGAAFVVGHASGYVYLYHKVSARLP